MRLLHIYITGSHMHTNGIRSFAAIEHSRGNVSLSFQMSARLRRLIALAPGSISSIVVLVLVYHVVAQLHLHFRFLQRAP